jgi:hypothetical protein
VTETESLAAVISTAIKAATAPLFARIGELEARCKSVESWTSTQAHLPGDFVQAFLKRLETVEQRAPVPGPHGEKGDTGEKGERGEIGPAGKDGRDGIDGKDGANGLDGKDGATGRDGKDGVDGLRGKDGAPGRDGKDAAIREELEVEEMTSLMTELFRSELALPTLSVQKRVLRNANGQIERVVEERVEGAN